MAGEWDVVSHEALSTSASKDDPWAVVSHEEGPPEGSLSKSFQAAASDVLGGIGAIADTVGSLPGLIGAGTAAAARSFDTNTGRGPKDTLNEIMQSASKGNAMDYVPGMGQLRKYSGYEPVSQTISDSFTVPAQGLGNIAAAASDATGLGDPSKVGEYTDVLSQAAMLLAGLTPETLAKPGTPEFFAAQAKLENSMKVLQDNKQVRDQYVELAKQEQAKTAAEAQRASDFQVADQAPLDLGQDVPFAGSRQGGTLRPEDLSVDENGMPINKGLSDEVAKTELGTEPPVQADMFSNPDIGLQLKQPLPDEPGPKPLPLEGDRPLEGVDAAEAVHTPDWTDAQQRMNENAAEPYGESPFIPGTPTEASNVIDYKPHLKGPEATMEPHVQEAVDMVNAARAAKDQPPTSPNVGKFGQGGAVDPGVFLEGLQKIVGFIPKSMDAAREALTSKLNRAMDTRDTFMAPLYRDKLKELGQLDIGSDQRGAVGDVKANKAAKTQASIAEDNALIEKFKAGDSSAFGQLYEKYAPRLEKMLNRKARNEADAADMLQDTFIRAANALPNFRGDSQFFSWLYNIGENVWKSKVTHDQSRIKTTELTPEIETMSPGDREGFSFGSHEMGETPESILSSRQTQDRLDKAIESLPEEYATTFKLRHMEDLDYAEIADLQGVSIGTVKSRLHAARGLLDKAIKKMDTEAKPRDPFRGPGRRQAGAIMFDFQKKADKVGLARAAIDHLKQFDIERRPISQIVAEEHITPENVQDFGGDKMTRMGRMETLKDKFLTNAAIDKTMSILAQTKSGLGKIVKGVVDQNRQIARDMNIQVRDALETGLKTWKEQMKSASSRETLKSALETWWDNVGKEKLQRESFPSEATYKAYSEISDMLGKQRDRVNEWRDKYGLKPIDFIENYLPGMWEGDYKVQVKNALDEVIFQDATGTAGEANRIAAELQKQFPDHTVNAFPSEPNKNGLHTLEAFEATMKMLKDDPMAKTIQKAYLEILNQRSFGRHGAHKKGIAGSMGREMGNKGLYNMEKVFEQYVTQSENYIANLKRNEIRKQVEAISPEIQAKIPRGMEYMRDYVSMSKGADMNQLPFVNATAEAISEFMGTGKSGPKAAVQKVMSTASIYFLATPRFFLSQLAQWMNAIPKMVDLHQLDPNMNGTPESFFNGLRHSVSPDSMAKEAAQWAVKNGYMESALASMMDIHLHEIHRSKLGVIGDLFGKASSKVEHYAVRLPTYLSFEYSLRNSVPDKVARFEKAAELTDYYMVHYDRSSSPLMYSKLGLVGDAARPLKQFSHNMWGQFFEYAKTAKDQGRLAPLGTFLGIQAAVAGLKGTILVTEAAIIVNTINAMFNTDIPTPEKLLFGAKTYLRNHFPDYQKLVSNLMDTLVYGGYSSILGYDVSSSVSAPSVSQMFTFAPVSFTYAAVKDAGNYLIKTLQGTATNADAMQAMMSISPNLLRGFIEEAFSEPGQPVPRPSENMKGNYVRTPEEKTMAKVMAMKSLNEANVDALVRQAKKQFTQDFKQKVDIIDKMVDQFNAGQQPDDALIEQYMKEGGNVSRLPKVLMMRSMELSKTYEDRTIKPAGRMSPEKGRKIDVLDNLSNETEYQKRNK